MTIEELIKACDAVMAGCGFDSCRWLLCLLRSVVFSMEVVYG